METLFLGTAVDPELEILAARIEKSAGKSVVETFGMAIRQAVEDTLDGPRTGRWVFDELEKTEKTYVGTKIEILLRAALSFERGRKLDFKINGVDVDLKWAMKSRWQIPNEAVGQLCLCVGGLKDMSAFQVGLIRCLDANLTLIPNRDGKRTISAAGRKAMRMLVEEAPVPSNFLGRLDAGLRVRVMGERTIQGRVTRLFRELPYEPIPRGAVQTVAQTTGDPMRRVRADAAAGDIFDGMKILSGSRGNSAVAALGRPPLRRDEFMAVPWEDLEALPRAARRKLPAELRDRLGLA
jgi:hypothetical protein